uniref:Olfactory receptor n=1 Tax=Salvator merianae TaxID=96440 RepID=A0A8D0BH83_SALMN
MLLFLSSPFLQAGSNMAAENVTSIQEFILVGLTSHRKTQILLFGVVLLIYVATVFGNLMIILLVQVDSHLHIPMYFFLTNLATLEICYVTSTLPQALAHLLNGNGAISVTCCMLQMDVALTLGSTECLLLSAMAYDRYLAICHPLLYATAMDKGRQLQLASACWTIAFLLSLITVYFTFRHPFCGPNRISHFICELPVVLKLACADTCVTEALVSGLAVFVALVPLSVILLSYILIFNSVLHMRSNARRHKAFSTCSSHLLVVVLFYGCVIAMYVVPRSGPVPDRDKHVAVFYFLVTPLLNPIIYSFRNKDVHTALTKVLKRRPFGVRVVEPCLHPIL